MEKQHKPKMASFMLRAYDNKPRFSASSNCSFSLYQKHNLNHLVCNFLIKHQ